MMTESFEFLSTDDLRDDEILLRLAAAKPANAEMGYVPAYQFDICLLDGTPVGTCDLRVGYSSRLRIGGNIGYSVDEPYRGRHYAARACRQLLKLAARHGMEYVDITCNPDNVASARTCELAGGRLLGRADVPKDHDMYARGERQVLIYRFDTISLPNN